MYLSHGLGAASTGIAALIQSLAPSYGVPPQLALAVAQHESSLDPNAVGSAGEIGLFQVKPSTAAQFGVSASGLYDPNQNATAGLSYLSQMFQKFGNWFDALSAYNAGPGNLKAGQGYASAVLASAGPLDSSASVSDAIPDASASPFALDLSFFPGGSEGLSATAWAAIGVGLLGALVWAFNA